MQLIIQLSGIPFFDIIYENKKYEKIGMVYMFNWKVAYAPHSQCKNVEIKSIDDVNKSGFCIIPAKVPGNIEIDLMNAGKLGDIYYSVNTLEAQKLENLDLWYYTVFETDDDDIYLHFKGIDTVSDIYINGKLSKSTDNMFIEYDVNADFRIGTNEIVVHIKPFCIEARKYVIPSGCSAQPYNYQALHLRKAMHMLGWDIMPRIVSAGIWKDVEIRKKKSNKINEVFIQTTNIDTKKNSASMRFYINFDADGDFITDYSIKVRGGCVDSTFGFEKKMWHNSVSFVFNIDNCRLWWPKNSGEPNLYDTTVELLYKGEVCDSYKLSIGVRTVKLNMTDVTDENGSGDFCFEINGKKVFALGTNWVPLDALHSRDIERLGKAFELLDDIGCNMVRCWGGNVYESDEFFDLCDRHGIMVWQDFGMACEKPPQDDDFANAIAQEAAYIVKRLRNHPSLVLWAGDNENDQFYRGAKENPNNNVITRQVLPKVLRDHDLSRPYLPSSPYISDTAFKTRGILPEDHLWGPRDYFKGNYYSKSLCHFASETGYHGFPSTLSLKRFLKTPEKIFKEGLVATDEYLVHASCMEASIYCQFSYRIKLAYNQVVTLFGNAGENLDDFVRQSQISQAEAKKYFIERFRIGKWRRTGIIWWNLIDGWPQVSDSVVDYYYCKKLAYKYIKRSQNPICLMFDEPKDNTLDLYGVNDLPADATAEYTVTNITENKEVLRGTIRLKADTSEKIAEISIREGEQCFYLIEWNVNGQSGRNHYYTNIRNIDYNRYMDEIKKCGFDEFEGMGEEK